MVHIHTIVLFFYHCIDKKSPVDICRAPMELKIKIASQSQVDCLRDILLEIERFQQPLSHLWIVLETFD